MIKFLILVSVSFFNPEIKKDSIGMETINGKQFVVHKVGAGETLYAISKRYGVTVEKILEQNPTADAGLEIDQVLKVPYVPRAAKKNTSSGAGDKHIVAEKETLFSISRQYGVSVDDIKQWNNLTDNALALGQELIIRKKNTNTVVSTPTEIKTGKGVHTVAAKETMFSIIRQYGITVQQLREWNSLQTDELKIGQTLYVTQPVYSKTQTTTTTATNSNTTTAPVQQQTQIVTPPVVQNTIPPSTTPTEITPTIKISESVRGTDEIIESGSS